MPFRNAPGSFARVTGGFGRNSSLLVSKVNVYPLSRVVSQPAAAAAQITRVDTTITTTATTATSITPTPPTGVISGDFLIVRASLSKTATTWASSTYTGWTTLYETTEGSLVQQILTRVADGTATDNPPQMDLTATQTAGMIATVAAYRGVDTTTPVLVDAAPLAAPSTQTAHPATAIVNTDPNAWGVYAGTARQVATPLTWTPGAGLVEQEDADNGVANTNNVAAIWADSDGPVATGSTTYSATTSTTTAVSLAWAAFLKPAVVPDGSPRDVFPNPATSTPGTFDPTVTATVTTTPDVATSSPAVFAPTLTSAATVTPNVATTTPATFNPTLTSTIAVVPGVATSAPATFNPTLTTTAPVLIPDLATSAPTVSAPTVTSTITIAPSIVTSSPATFQPFVYRPNQAQTVTPNLVASAPQVFAPTVTQTAQAGAERTLEVAAESRRITVTAENRQLTVAADSRTAVIEAEDRTVDVAAAPQAATA